MLHSAVKKRKNTIKLHKTAPSLIFVVHYYRHKVVRLFCDDSTLLMKQLVWIISRKRAGMSKAPGEQT